MNQRSFFIGLRQSDTLNKRAFEVRTQPQWTIRYQCQFWETAVYSESLAIPLSIPYRR